MGASATSRPTASARERAWPPARRARRRRRRRRQAAAPGRGATRLVQADCLRWVAEAGGQYDLIWLDPPTFTNSKNMGRATFDVQRDHADLIRLTARRLLAPGGILLFATNRRDFQLDHGELGGLAVKDLSRATLAFDCERGANRHHVFRVERAASPALIALPASRRRRPSRQRQPGPAATPAIGGYLRRET